MELWRHGTENHRTERQDPVAERRMTQPNPHYS